MSAPAGHYRPGNLARLVKAVLMTGLLTFAWAGQAQQPQAGELGQESERAPSRSPRDRMILSVPVLRGENSVGEIEVAASLSGDVQFDSKSVVAILEPILSENGVARLSSVTDGRQFIYPAALREVGIDIVFDLSQLEVRIVGIETGLLKVTSLAGSALSLDEDPPTVEPAGFSAYLNLAGNFEYLDGGLDTGLQNPDILGFGTIRAGRFALEYEGGLTEVDDETLNFYRRFVRGIYDIEERNLRFSAGDLQTTSLPILGSQLIGGLGIERRRRIFEPFESVFELGGRRIRIDSPSTIEIMRNGNLVQTVPVDQGVFDLESLPLVAGSNDVEIIIRDAAGRTSVTSFDYFYDPVDLQVGDYEYGFYAGFVSDLQSLDPSYTGDIAATGFYRKALTPSLLIGAGAQASKDIQAAAVEANWVPQAIPGVIESEFSLSNGSEGVGFAARVGYRWSAQIDAGGRQAAFIIDYESPGFELVGRPALFNDERLSITGSYGQNITPLTYVTAGLNYFKRRDDPARTSIFADVIHQFTPRLRGTAGGEYGKGDGFGSSFGVRVGLTLVFGARNRADASYDSRRDLFRSGISRSIENRVGSFGYDALYQSNRGSSSADASLRYHGNRFDGRVLVNGSGEGFGNITDRRRAQVQLSSSLAYADGAFGIGRPISDGFALVTPHPDIEGQAIVGNNLNDGEYLGRSGLFGAAVVPDLNSYQTREVIYDIDVVDTTYDIGEGTDRVRVATGGGAKIVVGSARFASVIGTLVDSEGPVSLASGTVSSETDDGFQRMAFFTNSVGRFSVIGLAPGETYDVLLKDGRKFALVIPKDGGGLVRLDKIEVRGEDQ